tara:strand:+ start:1454 stop:3568 length:2115 start_codon:yes stop_codon:yes gene_type:complete
MPLTKLQFRPGVNRETTSYSNEGGWFDTDKVRFRFGYPEKIGGWIKQSSNAFLGTARALHPWIALDGSNFLGVGTHLKYYINEGGGYNDITPIRSTTSAGDVTFSASANDLNGAIDADADIITLTSTSGFPGSGRIKIENEIITYAALDGNNLEGCERGQSGTTAASHADAQAVTCATIIVTDTNHGALENDFVTFSGAATLGANITANVLNQEYQITALINDNSYQIEARTVSTIESITTTSGLSQTFVFATSSDSGSGGGSVVGAYQINTGLDTTIVGNGWGAGTWGRGTWNSSADLTAAGQTLRIWSHDNFGEDLIINVRDNNIYYWDRTNSITTRAVQLSTLAGSNKAPVVAKQIIVSDRDRHVIAFGCDSETNPGVQDPLLIRFCDQENVLEWQSLVTNTAGDLRIGSGSRIVTAVETRQQILVYTDVSLHAMQFLGPPFTFGINAISEGITIAGPLCAIAVEDSVFWMGAEEFYVYAGSVQRLPCSVRDYVFNDINSDQLEKVTAGLNSAFAEVTWFYPSGSSTENDRYVTYNYQQKIWYYGNLPRTVWLDRGVNAEPLAASSDHYLYLHEIGFDDGSTEPASAITAFIESSQMDLGEGDQFAFMRRLIPDVTFRNSTAETPSAVMTLKVRNFPGGDYLSSDASTVSKTASLPVEQFTDQVYVRLRGRSFALRMESQNTGVTWRLGSPRVDIRPDGRR